jgi:hypothetical protein
MGTGKGRDRADRAAIAPLDAPGAALAAHQPQAATMPGRSVTLGLQARSAAKGKSVHPAH